MKRTISFILALCLVLAMSVLAIGCNKEPEHNHSAQVVWQTDATHHWHACDGEECEEQLNKTEHNFGTELRRNDTHHYLMCECGAKSNEQAHVYDHALDTSCNVCGPTRNLPTIYELEWDNDGYVASSEEIQGVAGQTYIFKLEPNEETNILELYVQKSVDGVLHDNYYVPNDDFSLKIFDENFNEIKFTAEGIDIIDVMIYDGEHEDVYVWDVYDDEDLYIMITLNESVDFVVWLQ